MPKHHPPSEKEVMELFENVLKEDEHLALYNYVTSAGFSWSYNRATWHIDSVENDTPQMVRAIYSRDAINDRIGESEPFTWSTQQFRHKYFWTLPYLHDIPKRCGFSGEYYRIKINLLQPYPNPPEHHPYHVDVHIDSMHQYLFNQSSDPSTDKTWNLESDKIKVEPFTSYLYYINDVDGDTWFKSPDGEEKRISPKKNTLIKFPSNLLHASSNPTTGPRFIISFVTNNLPLMI